MLPEIEIGQRLRDLKTDLRIGHFSIGNRLIGIKFFQLGKSGEHLAARLSFRGTGLVIVVEKLNPSPKIRLLLVEQKDLESPPPRREQIHESIRVTLQHPFDNRRAAGIADALLTRQHDSKFGLRRNHLAHHFLVAILEDMKRQRSPRKQHRAERKQRQQVRLHVYYYVCCP